MISIPEKLLRLYNYCSMSFPNHSQLSLSCRGAENRTRSSCSQSKCTTGILRPGFLSLHPQLVVNDSVAVCADDFTFIYFPLKFSKSDFSSEATYSEQFIFAFFVMKIKHARIFDATSSAPHSSFVLTKPHIMLFYKSLFHRAITITTFPTTINLRRRCHGYSESIFGIKDPTIVAFLLWHITIISPLG